MSHTLGNWKRARYDAVQKQIASKVVVNALDQAFKVLSLAKDAQCGKQVAVLNAV